MTEGVWIRRPALVKGAAARLFCLPPAGRGAAQYHAWARELSPAIDVAPVHLPGRESRMSEPAAKRVAEIVEPLCDALAPLLDVPYAMWGHSMGGILAYETTRELRRRHARLPVTLVVAACRAPHVPRRMPPIHALDDESFIAEIRRRYGGLPESTTTDRLSAELLRLMTPTLRADVTLAETYQYIEEPPLICQLVALGGADDAAVTEADLAAWRDHTTGDFEVHRLPGGHFFPDRQRPAIFDILRHALR